MIGRMRHECQVVTDLMFYGAAFYQNQERSFEPSREVCTNMLQTALWMVCHWGGTILKYYVSSKKYYRLRMLDEVWRRVIVEQVVANFVLCFSNLL